MNQRITTQATLWAGIGTFSDLSGRAEARRAYLGWVSRDCTDEMNELVDMAKSSFATMSKFAARSGT
jgi:hypothetical protein